MSSATRDTAAIWPYLVMLALAIVLLLLLGRPCEFYRLKVTLNESAFPWMGTVCAPWPDGRCNCIATDPGNPMMIREGMAPHNPLARDEIRIEVEF